MLLHGEFLNGKGTVMYRRSFLNALMSAAAFVAILGLSACGGSPASGPGGSTSGSQDSSDDISTLTVGFDQSYPPYGYVGDDGEYTGFDLDLAAEVAKRNGWDLELEPIDWDAKDTLLSRSWSFVLTAESVPWRILQERPC